MEKTLEFDTQRTAAFQLHTDDGMVAFCLLRPFFRSQFAAHGRHSVAKLAFNVYALRCALKTETVVHTHTHTHTYKRTRALGDERKNEKVQRSLTSTMHCVSF